MKTFNFTAFCTIGGNPKVIEEIMNNALELGWKPYRTDQFNYDRIDKGTGLTFNISNKDISLSPGYFWIYDYLQNIEDIPETFNIYDIDRMDPEYLQETFIEILKQTLKTK